MTGTTKAPAFERDPLERLGNAVWIATLTVLASLGVVTALAAFAAGLRAMEGVGDTSRAPTREFWTALRATWRRSLPLMACCLAVALVASVDLVVAPSLPGQLPAVVATAGLVLVFGLVQIWPYTAMELAERTLLRGRRETAGSVLRGAASRAGRRPVVAAFVGLLGVAAVAAMVAVPALSPVAMGGYLGACTGALVRTRDRTVAGPGAAMTDHRCPAIPPHHRSLRKS
jgi:hypothetical protein